MSIGGSKLRVDCCTRMAGRGDSLQARRHPGLLFQYENQRRTVACSETCN